MKIINIQTNFNVCFLVFEKCANKKELEIQKNGEASFGTHHKDEGHIMFKNPGGDKIDKCLCQSLIKLGSRK